MTSELCIVTWSVLNLNVLSVIGREHCSEELNLASADHNFYLDKNISEIYINCSSEKIFWISGK